jgi:hypothetical protein
MGDTSVHNKLNKIRRAAAIHPIIHWHIQTQWSYYYQMLTTIEPASQKGTHTVAVFKLENFGFSHRQ